MVAQTPFPCIIPRPVDLKGEVSLMRFKILFVVAMLLTGMTLGCDTPPEEAPPVPTAQAATTPAQGEPVPSATPREQEAPVQATESPLPSPSPLVSTPEPSMPTPLPLASPVARGAATVNGRVIPLAEFEAQVEIAQRYMAQGADSSGQATTLPELRRQVLDWMIDQVLIEQAAEREGANVTDDQVEAEIQKMRSTDEAKFNEWLRANGLTVETLRARLRSEMLGAALADRIASNVPSRVVQVHVRHILTSTQGEAEEVVRRVQAGEDFAALARQFSLDQTTGELGGDLGFLPRGIMSPEFDAVAFDLAVGEVSGVVQSEYGYHVIHVVEKDPSREVPAELMPALRQHAFQDWLEQEHAGADIVILIQ